MKPADELRALIARLDDGAPEWAYRLWQVAGEGLRSWTRHELPGVGPCEASDLCRLSRSAGGWFVAGEFVPAERWAELYQKWGA